MNKYAVRYCEILARTVIVEQTLMKRQKKQFRLLCMTAE